MSEQDGICDACYGSGVVEVLRGVFDFCSECGGSGSYSLVYEEEDDSSITEFPESEITNGGTE